MNMLIGKNVIITGARRGIGRATVEVFAQNGANVWACARKQDDDFEKDMRAVASANGVSVTPVYFDATDSEAVKNAVQEIKKTKLPVDALINVAGIADESTSFQMTSIDKMKRTFDVNFWGVTLLTQYVSRIMAKQLYGSIVNISSVAAIDGKPAQYEYASSKAAIIGATKELSVELAKYNIRVNAVAPGMIDTDMGAQIDNDLKNSILQHVNMGRLGKPAEVANAIAFLASDAASFITGQIIRVDGGM